MSELSKKEIKQKFNETEYGKKLNKYLIVTCVIFTILFIVIMLNVFEVINLGEFYTYFYLVFILVAMLTSYFDGKRDGAIQQFKRNLNK